MKYIIKYEMSNIKTHAISSQRLVALKLSKRMERTASEESLEIPEEPKEDLVDEFGKENSKKENEDETTRRGSSGINFSTAVKIARWMARAYGYVAKKRQAYLVSFVCLKKAQLNHEFNGYTD